uniref:rRNA N-glycosylase n=1 Tax=Arundo donax TaxID=35708 RepID=A0A0A9GC02_ARUDO
MPFCLSQFQNGTDLPFKQKYALQFDGETFCMKKAYGESSSGGTHFIPTPCASTKLYFQMHGENDRIPCIDSGARFCPEQAGSTAERFGMCFNTFPENDKLLSGLAARIAQAPYQHQVIYPDAANVNEHYYARDGIRNTVTMSLDDSDLVVWRNYLETMTHIRLWFCSRGTSLDISEVVGYEKIIHVVPNNGTFHLVLTYRGKSVVLILDARESWLDGAAGSNAIYQFSRGGLDAYITHEHAITLSADGKYMSIAEDGKENVPIGTEPLRGRFTVLEEFDGDSASDEVS